MPDIELGRCPFCGGTARLSRREVRFIGWRDVDGRREKIVDYAYQVICNKCRARGPLRVRRSCTKNEVEEGRFDPKERMEAMFGWNIRQMNGHTYFEGSGYIGTNRTEAKANDYK